MRLTVQQLIDYQKCPTLYKFRWVDQVDVSLVSHFKLLNKWHMYERFDKALHQVIYGLFYQLADGRYPNAYYIKKRWGDIWNKGRTKEDVLFYSENEHRRLERKGLKALLALHSDFKNHPGTPILIGKEYIIQVGKHQLIGTIDLVRETRNEEGTPIIQMMDFKADDRPTILHVKGDMEVTAASKAFYDLFNYKEDSIAYHGVMTGQQKHTMRTEQDYKLLELAVDNIARAIEDEIYYPVLNHQCNECPFQKHCEKKEWF